MSSTASAAVFGTTIAPSRSRPRRRGMRHLPRSLVAEISTSTSLRSRKFRQIDQLDAERLALHHHGEG